MIALYLATIAAAAVLGALLGELRAGRKAIDADHLLRQRNWSLKTFGPGSRTKGVLAHIRRELDEVEAEPGDVFEWADIVILAFDGALRAGHAPQRILSAIKAKQKRNEARTWPDWRTMPADEPIEHVRSES